MFGETRREAFFLLGVLLISAVAPRPAHAQLNNPDARSAARSILPSAPARRASDAWVPPDIDSAPQGNLSGGCSLPDVLDGAGKRVHETLENLDRFTATEHVEHQSVNGAGKLAKAQTRKFDYVVSIGSGKGGYLDVREYRSRAREAEQFPDRVATEGTPSLVLIFHPLYARDFDMSCEGLGEWRGQPAWQVRFEQRQGTRGMLNSIVMNNKAYPVRLRGRAWILKDSYQVARLETDLADTIPAIQLRLEHLSVEYSPVEFSRRGTELWLPSSAELYLDFSGRRFYRKHTFADFTLFSVDVEQTAKAFPAAQ